MISAPDRPGRPALRFGNRKRQATANRVVLAVYQAADADGLYCHATNGAIAEAAGLAPETVKGYLSHMESAGMIAVFRPGQFGVSHRVMVLLDHPEGAETAREMDELYGVARAWA